MRRANIISVVAIMAVSTVMAACGGGDAERATLTGEAARGEKLVSRFGCLSCHSIDGSRRMGPTWEGLAGSEVKLADGRTMRADTAYLRRAILEPDAEIVAGYPAGLMASTVRPGSVTEEEANAMVAYLETLGSSPPDAGGS